VSVYGKTAKAKNLARARQSEEMMIIIRNNSIFVNSLGVRPHGERTDCF
jgi:hypothetical protein